ncbi:DNA primase family protein [Cohnella yongneupensis]|uniref:Phage/plasmid primase, P4 family n=1 Tax=Cohnella yongneupensis TaxID=425006 RepID=A0ABW0QXU7_9BACL
MTVQNKQAEAAVSTANAEVVAPYSFEQMKISMNLAIRVKNIYFAPVIEESVSYGISHDPFFQWAMNNTDKLNEPLVEGLVSNLMPLGDDGKGYFDELLKVLAKDNSTKSLVPVLEKAFYIDNGICSPISYHSLVQGGYSGEVPYGGFESPASSIQRDIQEVKMKNRGISVMRGKVEINSNIFASFVLRRLCLVQLENGQIFAYTNSGYYIEMSDRLLRTICRDVLHDAKSNIWKKKYETEYIEALKREIPYVERMNSEPKYLNLRSGMLGLYSRELVSHDPKFLSTFQIPIDYYSRAECPEFIEFIYDIFDGDEERVKLVQEWMGYCFLNEVKIQASLICLGTGSNGKSVLAEIIRNLIGVENVSNVSLNALNGRFGLQNLPGKLVNISAENELSQKFNTQNFKMLTSGDAVNVEQKYLSSFNTNLVVKSIILLNSMMVTDDLSNGFFRRLLILPFNKTYRELKAGETPVEGISYMDKGLTKRLLMELPGILVFALEGLARLVQNDFNLTRSKVCDQALARYKNELNPVAEYIEDQVYQSDGEVTLRSRFKEDFDKWANENGYAHVKSINATKFMELFRRTLKENGMHFHEAKSNGYWHMKGIGIYL